MRSIPRLTWLNFKQHRSSLGDRKNSPGRKEEQAAAVAFDAATYETVDGVVYRKPQEETDANPVESN
jgi:hypothetical protein